MKSAKEAKEISAEEIRSRLIGLILWKLFGREAAFWINAQTKAGNQVPLDLLVAAYSVRKNASILASKTQHGFNGGSQDTNSGDTRHRRSDS